MPSGVIRLRNAHGRKGGTNPRMKNPSSGKKNTVKMDVNVGSDLRPEQRSGPYVFQDFPTTKPPLSDERPSRGEHGRNTSQRKSSSH